jgi:uncharacterized surface protein with fasciclin (FAS1) repeats
MKKLFKGMFSQYAKLVIGLFIGGLVLASCSDNYLQDHEPEWLGASIYDYLKTDGHFTNYTKLIEDLNYTEVLSKTGSKTLFVANDSAFNAFYKQNVWGVTSYNQFTLAQKKLILNFGMINDAYLVEMLSNYNAGVLKEGAGMRKVTAVSVLDSLPFVNGQTLPDMPYWRYYRDKGIYLLQDNTPWTTMFFTKKHLEQAQITNEDFNLLTGLSRTDKDAHVFGNKIIRRDITCKNGYLNVLQSVQIPPVNMAQYVTSNLKMKLFSRLLERFSAPFYDAGNTLLYLQSHPTFTDTIFTKKYFAKLGGSTKYPSGLNINTDLLLPFDPGWNSYTRNSVGAALESDMGAMFVPNDEAMEKFFNSGAGAVLKDRFGTWDNIPTEILPLFIKRHMRTSIVESVPSRFYKMVDEDNSVLPVSKSDVENVYLGSNGVVYETNKVYPPDDYNSVYGPVLLSANDASTINKTKIWKWAITQNDFRLYLNSMVSTYSFFVPTDEYFTKYIDPIAFAKDVPGALKYWYNSKTNAVNATVYKYNKVTGEVGDSVAIITSTSYLTNRLLDLLNMHIVVGGVETGKEFYVTKGNVALRVTGAGSNMQIEGGGNMLMNDPVKVNRVYNQSNGYTYFIDKPIQSPLSSVFKILSTKPEFSSFFTLLSGFPANSSSVIFVNKTNYYGIDFNIKFFNTFNYTVYVPTNDAIDKAIADGIIKPWDSKGVIVGINDMTDKTLQANEILNLERFIRYHFQDNSVFLDGQSVSTTYQSATMKTDDAASYFGTFKNKYFKIGVDGTGNDLTLTTENNKVAHVVTTPGLYNIMTRDFVFSNKPSAFKNVDGTGTGSEFSSSTIYTSSTAVIHQIDAVLTFK